MDRFEQELRLIEAEFLAYTNLTPDKQAALARLARASGFQDWWAGALRRFDPAFRERVEVARATST